MAQKEYNTLVCIMRAQPFHLGHKAVIDKALEKAHEVVIVLGSAKQPRSIKNPFTVSERKEMIRAVYTNEYNYAGAQGRIKLPRVVITDVMDYPYDDNAWVSAVQTAVNSVKTVYNQNLGTGLIGHSKDHSSFYLKIFPDWRKHVEVDNVDGINATDIRNKILDYKGTSTYLYRVMPKETVKYLEELVYVDEYGNMSENFDDLSAEFQQVKRYKESWSEAPHKPTFVTTDAVLTQSGYILLIERGDFPFKGKWALPGGYIAMGQMVEDNMIKELREETCIKVPDKVLRGSIKDRAVFDHPDRDPRGRTITHGFYIDLGFPDERLPKVKGGDDAKNAKWFPLSQVKPEMMAFDHYHIIKHFIPTY